MSKSGQSDMQSMDGSDISFYIVLLRKQPLRVRVSYILISFLYPDVFIEWGKKQTFPGSKILHSGEESVMAYSAFIYANIVNKDR